VRQLGGQRHPAKLKGDFRMWIYLETERAAVYTVGHYLPKGNFEADSDHATRAEARERVNFLNGGEGPEAYRMNELLERIAEKLNRLPGGG